MLNAKLLDNKIKNAQHVKVLKHYTQTHPIMSAGLATASVLVASTLVLGVSQTSSDSVVQKAFAEESSTPTIQIKNHYRSTQDMYPDYSQYGITSIYEYQEMLETGKREAEGAADALITALGNFMTEEQKQTVIDNQTCMTTAVSLEQFNEAKAEFEAIALEAESKYEASIVRRAAHYSGGNSYSYQGGSGVLTRSGGVNWFGGRKETWYSTRELGQNQTAYRIPGKWVGSDGIIRDQDGYICVAASDLKAGAVVETSLGTGKVYDTGCRPGVTDIYTTW